MKKRKLKYENYETQLQRIGSKTELEAFLQLMTEEADEVLVIKSPKVKDAHEIFFKGLPGLTQGFLIFKDQEIARSFGQPDGGFNNLLFFVQNGEVFCFPHAFSESGDKLQ